MKDAPDSPFPVADAWIQGWLYRGSDIVPSVVNKRYGAVLKKGSFVTFRRRTDKAPSQIRPLEGCEPTSIFVEECTLKPKGSNTVSTIVFGSGDKLLLYGFRLNFQGETSARPVTIYFDAQEEAASWRDAIIKEARRVDSPVMTRFSVPVAQHAPFLDATDQALAPAASAPNMVHPPRPTQASPPVAGASGSAAGDWPETDLMSAAHSLPAYRRKVEMNWARLQNVNGTIVYMEEEGPHGVGGAIMVSAVIRANPDFVFKKLEELDITGGEVLVREEGSIIMRHEESLGGMLGWFCAPRDTVLLRTWSRDDSGSYNVQYRSVDSDLAPAGSPGWFDWSTPVRLSVHGAGLTIAPLNPEFIPFRGTPSPESLATLAIKADAGGWLGEQGLLSRVVGVANLRLAVLTPYVNMLIALRDRVEQERFVASPMDIGAAVVDPEPQPLLQQRSLAQARCQSLFRIRSSREDTAEGDEGSMPKLQRQLTSSALQAWAKGTLDESYWSCPGSAGLQVRGPKYLQDRKKVAAGPPMFSLAAADLVRTRAKAFHVAPHLPSMKLGDAPFSFVLNLMIPGPPFLNLVFSWCADCDPEDMQDAESVATTSVNGGADSDEDASQPLTPFDITLARFLSADDKERNNYFKLIPKVVQGSWIIKQAVGTTPVVLGRKLTTTYHRGHLEASRSYIEVDVDIGSSTAASGVVGLVQGATKSLVIDMAILLEGREADELPESLIGSVRASNMDLATYKFLDLDDGGRVYTTADPPPDVASWK